MKTSLRVLAFLTLIGVVIGSPQRASAQLSQKDEERLQILSDPDALKKKQEKDRVRAAFEFFRSQVAPFDVLPLVKPFQWSSLALDLRANYEDYEGNLQFLPVLLAGMPQEVVYAREARLRKEDRAHLIMQVMLPRIPQGKELSLELVHPGAIRHDELWTVPVRLLPPRQMLVVILSKEGTNDYAAWNRLPCLAPSTADREDPIALDLQRYYRLVIPEQPDKPYLSAHPLTWSTISHVIWDGLPPDLLSVSHQEAMLDWLHWGGQIVLVGGAGPNLSSFRDSFLAPYLPADPTGESKLLGAEELRPLSLAYPPPAVPSGPEDRDHPGVPSAESPHLYQPPYKRPEPIQPPRARPVAVATVTPRPGAVTIALGEGSPYLLAVETRVGRGRVTMLTLNPQDPSLRAWAGLDSLVRRVVLRRPEEYVATEPGSDGQRPRILSRVAMDGPDLSWYRIASRDGGAPFAAQEARAQQRARAAAVSPGAAPAAPAPGSAPQKSPDFPAGPGSQTAEAESQVMIHPGVAEWKDTSAIPRVCRDLLEQASGITVPSARFVLRVILAYLLAVVPLNWLFCRLLLNRREWAWLIVPLIALGFAVGVERMAAYDMGYDSACDEVDLLEVHGGYPRGHLSRFASLYTTGRARYSIAYPNAPTALALPLSNERSIGGEDVTTAVWQSYPVPALREFSVQPRSLAMYRAEQMLGLSGSIRLEGSATDGKIVNETDMELHDATLIDFSGTGQRRETYLGTIAAGATFALAAASPEPPAGPLEGISGPDPGPLLTELRHDLEYRPESQGELRLVAWMPAPIEGQSFDPALDRHRGFTAVLVHLRHGAPPSPHGPRYSLLASSSSAGTAVPSPRAESGQRRAAAPPDGPGGRLARRSQPAR